ncbi:MAG: hypothetical protein HS116_06410 [Planctomycetes bacterium]|nr:hypothetical protein [Planctomycetota bacterium]
MASDVRVQEFQRNLKVADALVRNAVRPEQHLDAQLNRAILYDAQGRHEEANAALLHAGDVAASEAAATSAKNPASPQPTPEHAAALTVLSHAHREMVRKEFASARRHLNLVVDRYAETAPIVVQQALSDLQWIATQEGSAIHAPETTVPAAAAGKRDIGDSSCHQKSIVPATSMGGAEIFANAVAGTSYTITASGIWAQDPDPSFNTGPNGFTGFGTIGGGEFAGMLFGTFAVREPGSSAWMAVGAGGTVTATADGPMVGVFADIAFAYNDNNGAMFVTVSSSECPPPPPAETHPPTAVNVATPETFYLDERGIWLDAGLSTDNDTEGEDPAICWYNWNLKSRTNPAQRASIVEGQEAIQSIYPTAPGEYDLVLTVTDNDGETATTSQVVKAVRVLFDPDYLVIPVGQTLVTVATVVPASAEGEILFSTPNPETIGLEAGGGGAGSISIAATGLSVGSTSILGYLESEPDRQGFMSVNVVPADPMTLPPTAIAATTTPVICAGGTVALDGSGSHDTDLVGPAPEIVTYTWTLTNLTAPAQPPVIVVASNPLVSTILVAPGEYEAELVVTDNDGESSLTGSTEGHVSVLVVGVTFTPGALAVMVGETEVTVATIVPANAAASVTFSLTDATKASISSNLPASAVVPIPVTGLSEGMTTLRAEVATGLGSEVCATADISVLAVPTGASAVIVDTEDKVLDVLGHKLDGLPVDSQGFGTVVTVSFASPPAAVVQNRNHATSPIEVSPERIDAIQMRLDRNQDGFAEDLLLTESTPDSLDFFSTDGTVSARVTRPPVIDARRVDDMELTLTSTRYLAIDTRFRLIETGKNTRTFKSPDRGLNLLFMGEPSPNRKDLVLALAVDKTGLELAPALLIETGKDTLHFKSPNGKTSLMLPSGVDFDSGRRDRFSARLTEQRLGVVDAPVALLETANTSLLFQSRGAGLSGSNTVVVRARMTSADATSPGADAPAITVESTLAVIKPDGTESQRLTLVLTKQSEANGQVIYVSGPIKIVEAGGVSGAGDLQAQEGARLVAKVKKPLDGQEVNAENEVSVYSVTIKKPTTETVVQGGKIEVVTEVSTGRTSKPAGSDLGGTLVVKDPGGNLVKEVPFIAGVTDGPRVVEWDGKGADNLPVAPGMYTVTVTVTPPGAPPTSTATSNPAVVEIVTGDGLPTVTIVDPTSHVMVSAVEVGTGTLNPDVSVTVNGLAAGQRIVLNFEPISGGGAALFDPVQAGNRRILETNGPHVIAMKGGPSPSASTGDVLLVARLDGKPAVLASDRFTCLWVDVDILTSGNVTDPEDNGALIPVAVGLGRTPPLKRGANTEGTGVGNLVEIVGHVRPPDFSEIVHFRRKIVSQRRYAGFDPTVTNPPQPGVAIAPVVNQGANDVDDTSGAHATDESPQSGSSKGTVYDIDEPGIDKRFLDVVGKVGVYRANFQQWAEYQGARCSPVKNWFTRVNVALDADDKIVIRGGDDDNKAGEGTTEVTASGLPNPNAPSLTATATPPQITDFPAAIQFTAQVANRPVNSTVEWRFGDGQNGQGHSIEHTYQLPPANHPENAPIEEKLARPDGRLVVNVRLDLANATLDSSSLIIPFNRVPDITITSFAVTALDNNRFRLKATAVTSDPDENFVSIVWSASAPLAPNQDDRDLRFENLGADLTLDVVVPELPAAFNGNPVGILLKATAIDHKGGVNADEEFKSTE